MIKIQDISRPYREAYAFEPRVEYQKQKKLYGLEIELTYKCFSGCSYCYASSVKQWDTSKELLKEEWLRVFDDALDMGVQAFSWPGGEPLLRKDWDVYLRYVKDKGGNNVRNFVASALSIIQTPETARIFVEVVDDVLFHFDSIIKTTFVETHPLGPSNEWENALKGMRLLLDAGFDPQHIHLSIPIVKPLLKSMEATFDYFFDYIGIGSYSGGVFKPVGRGKEIAKLAPTLKEIEWVYKLRARKMKNPAMMALGPSSIGKPYCETTICVGPEGDIKMCGALPAEYIVANVREKSIKEIWAQNRDTMLCATPEGPCGTCVHAHLCYGCRANAFYFTGNRSASDPSCWQNPEAESVYDKYLADIRE